MECETLRFLHAANLRFGQHVGYVADWSTEQRQLVADAGLRAFQNLIEACLQHQAEFVLITGASCTDATDWRIVVELRQGLQCLDEAGVRVFVAPMPTESTEVWTQVCGACSNVTLLDPADTEPVAFLRGQQVVATLQNHILCESTALEPGDRSEHTEAAVPRQPFRIGILAVDATFAEADDDWHGDHSEVVPDSGEELATSEIEALPAELVSQLADESLVDYVALANGDRPRQVRMRSRSQVANFPGTLQPMSFDEADWGGVTLVDVDRNGHPVCRNLNLAVLEWCVCDLSDRFGDPLAESTVELAASLDQRLTDSQAELCVLRCDIGVSGAESSMATAAADAIAAVQTQVEELRSARSWPVVMCVWQHCETRIAHTVWEDSEQIQDAWDQMSAAPQQELHRLLAIEHVSEPAVQEVLADAVDDLDVASLRLAVQQLVSQWFESSADQGAA